MPTLDSRPTFYQKYTTPVVLSLAPGGDAYRDRIVFLELAVIHFAGELQHPGLVPFHPDVDRGADVPGRRTLVLGVDFQQEPVVTAVEIYWFLEHHRRGTVGVHHQREFRL